MSNGQDLATEYADSFRATLADIVEALEAGTEYEDQDASEYLDEMPLEIVHRVGAPFRVVFTVGGPYAAVEAELGEDGARTGSAILEVSWGSGTAVRRGDAIDAVADHFLEVVGW